MPQKPEAQLKMRKSFGRKKSSRPKRSVKEEVLSFSLCRVLCRFLCKWKCFTQTKEHRQAKHLQFSIEMINVERRYSKDAQKYISIHCPNSQGYFTECENSIEHKSMHTIVLRAILIHGLLAA